MGRQHAAKVKSKSGLTKDYVNMKNKSHVNCVEIQLPSKGLKDKRGFPIKRTLYANHLLVLFEKSGQSVVFEAVSQSEYYINGFRVVSPQDNRAYYIFVSATKP